jgi:DNA-binding MarR family transcriptional regulator
MAHTATATATTTTETTASDTSASDTTVGELDEDLLRIGSTWRELRRGGSMLELRQLLYGGGGKANPTLDVAQGDALDAIIELGPVRMSDLAAALRVDASTATRTVARLSAAGLVTRTENKDDRRVVEISATAKGRRRQAEMVVTATASLKEILAVFDTDEIRTLGRLMQRLVDSLDDVVARRRTTV